MAAVYAVVVSLVCAVKHRYYLYQDFDLAIFAQAVDGILRGSTFNSIRGMNWLGDHASLILFLVAPLYGVAHHPLTLLILQTAVLALGALPVYLLARRELGDLRLAVTFAAIYLLYPALGYVNLFEFHPESLATTTLLFTFYFLRAGRIGPMFLLAGLSLLAREDVALVVAAMGLHAFSIRSPRRAAVALGLVALAAASLVLSFAVLRPAFQAGEATYGRMYLRWGGSMGEVMKNLVLHPLEAAGAFFSTPGDAVDTTIKREYYLHLLAPVSLLPLLSPLTLMIALPILAEHFLSARMEQHMVFFQYTALVTPFVLSAAVLGMRNLLAWRTRYGRRRASSHGRDRTPRSPAFGALAPGVPLLVALAGNVLFGPLSGSSVAQTFKPESANWPSAYERTLARHRDRMVARIGRGEGVVAGFEFLSRFTRSRNVHSAHHVLHGLYTFSPRPYPVPRDVAAFVADMGSGRLLAYVDPQTHLRLAELVRINRLRPVDVADGLVLFARDPRDSLELFGVARPEADPPRRVVFDGQVACVGGAPAGGTVRRGGVFEFVTEWRRIAPVDRLFMLQLELADATGAAVHGSLHALGYGFYPAHAWPEGARVRERSRFVVPENLKPGTYTLALRLQWQAGGQNGVAEVDDPVLRSKGGFLPVARVVVE
jgi:uncharacterized membrane protein